MFSHHHTHLISLFLEGRIHLQQALGLLELDARQDQKHGESLHSLQKII
jgi:hypothetical protein